MQFTEVLQFRMLINKFHELSANYSGSKAYVATSLISSDGQPLRLYRYGAGVRRSRERLDSGRRALPQQRRRCDEAWRG